MEIIVILLKFFAVIIGSVWLAGWLAIRIGSRMKESARVSTRMAELICLAFYAAGTAILIACKDGGVAAAFSSLFLISFSIVLLFASARPSAGKRLW